MNFGSIYILIGVIVSIASATFTFVRRGSVFENEEKPLKIAELIGYVVMIFAWPLTVSLFVILSLIIFIKEHKKNKEE